MLTIVVIAERTTRYPVGGECGVGNEAKKKRPDVSERFTSLDKFMSIGRSFYSRPFFLLL